MTEPRRDLLPVLWLTGPPGVGKTTVAWEIFSSLTEAGTEAGYVDIDQLGICRPDPPGDPMRYRTQARNLGAVLGSFQAAGARCAIVSGVIDAEKGVYADASAGAAITVCRLRADPDELRTRFAGRPGGPGLVDEVLQHADALDHSRLTELCVDTTGLGVEQVVRRVQELTQGWNRLSASTRQLAATASALPALPPASTRVLLLCGVTGVGKSTAGFELFERVARGGRRIAYIDLRQIGLYRPAPIEDPRNHRLKARNAGAMWRTYRAAGVQDLVLVGQVENRRALGEYTRGLEDASVTICRLCAGPEELRRRITLRGQGGSWPEPGDRLKGRSMAWLERIAEDAAAESEALDQAGIPGPRIATDGLTAEETADAVAAAVGWP